ncbi:hypothetical protein JCM6882_009189 [Rhodosporidiobolus microsporus]
MSAPVPVRVEENPPANQATVGGALNLAVLLEMHAADLARRGAREIRTTEELVFTKTTALAIRLAFDRHRLREDTLPWQLARQVLLPVESVRVGFVVRHGTNEDDSSDDESEDEEAFDAQRLLRAIKMEHQLLHGRQPRIVGELTVSRAVLKADPRHVELDCVISHEPLLPRTIRHLAGSNPRVPPLRNYLKVKLLHRLVSQLVSGFAMNPVPLVITELHLLLLDFLHDTVYGQGETRSVAFFALYLLGTHVQVLQQRNHLPEPLHHALRSLFLRLPPNGSEGVKGNTWTRNLMRALLMSGAAMPHATPRVFERQVQWHLSLPVQEGSGGERHPARLKAEYHRVYDAAVHSLRLATEGPEKHPSEFSSSALSLGKRAYQPVARRFFE